MTELVATAELHVEVPQRATSQPFSEVYRSELSYVCNSVLRLGIEPRHVADVAHDVFLVALQRWASYDPARRLRPWLFGIAFNRVQAYRARAFRHHEREIDPPDVSDGAPALDEGVAARQLVLRALAVLDLDKRAVFVMHDIDGDGAPEVAAALGVPLNTVYSRLRKARELFASEVTRLQGGGA